MSFSAKRRSQGTVLPMGVYAAPKGWTCQTGQQGGKPAVVVYKDGKLKRAKYLVGEKDKLSDKLISKIPTELKWQGTRSNFRVLGQVRDNDFEALAVTMVGDATIVANLTDSVATAAVHHGFNTPRLKLKQPKRITKGKRKNKTAECTVLTSTYADAVRIVWFNRRTGKVIKKIKLER